MERSSENSRQVGERSVASEKEVISKEVRSGHSEGHSKEEESVARRTSGRLSKKPTRLIEASVESD